MIEPLQSRAEGDRRPGSGRTNISGECQLALKRKGMPYPRTCGICGLGPCQRADGLADDPIEAAIHQMAECFAKPGKAALRLFLSRLPDGTVIMLRNGTYRRAAEIANRLYEELSHD